VREREWFNFMGRRFAVHAFEELMEQKPHRFERVRQSAASLISFNALVHIDKAYAAQLSEEQLAKPLYVVMLNEDTPLLIDGHHRLQRRFEENGYVDVIVAQPRMTRHIQRDD
jgi:hypothetical protein